MGNRLGNKGYISVSHLVYIIIIFVIVLSFFLIIAFGGTDNASNMMGTASTVSSLILSVIAIVMTLIDVAGQRQSIMDLKETADKLRVTNKSAYDLIQDLTVKMADLHELRESMVKIMTESDEWKKEFVNEIKDIIKDKEEVNSDDIESLIKKYVQKNEDIKQKDKNSGSLGLAGLVGSYNPSSFRGVGSWMGKDKEEELQRNLIKLSELINKDKEGKPNK
ncbi:hypothetical protein [Oceanobacillus caeni]|uniref:hypothetical protein n=1 Tax=Oceanobacillus caeni TaxID=405946 RepID=UPI0019568D3F